MIVSKGKGTPLTFQSIKIAFWGGIALGLNVAFFFESLKRTTVVNATIIGSLQPVLISVYSYKVFKEKVTRRDVFIGVIALVATFGVVAGSSGTTEWDVTGDLFACANIIYLDCVLYFSKQTQDRVSPLGVHCKATGVITGILNFLIALVFSVALTVPSSRDIFWLFILATVAGLICHSLMNWSLVRIPLWVGSILTFFVPVVSSLLAWIFLEESFKCSSDLLYLCRNL